MRYHEGAKACYKNSFEICNLAKSAEHGPLSCELSRSVPYHLPSWEHGLSDDPSFIGDIAILSIRRNSLSGPHVKTEEGRPTCQRLYAQICSKAVP